VHVQVGPVPATSVTMWVAYARTVLAQSITGSPDFPLRLDPDVVRLFERYLDEWEDLAERHPDFRWETDVDPERVEFVMHSFFQIAVLLEKLAEQRGYPLAPPAGEAFYEALVNGVVTAMEAEGRSLEEYAAQLRDVWPGIALDP
jgi:hypothetical protein